MTDFDELVAEADFPEFGSREWFQRLWSRAFRAADRCNWTFNQALRIAEGQNLVKFPRDLVGMPRTEREWYVPVRLVADDRLIQPEPDPLADCEMFNVPAERCLVPTPDEATPDELDVEF